MEDTLNTDELLTTEQAAIYCDMTKRCINIAVKEKRLALAPQSTPRRHLFYKSELQRFQESRSDHSKRKKNVKATDTQSSVVALSELCVDSELEALIAPLSDSEFRQLSDNCNAEGIRESIITWNGTIIDGHNRFRIAQTLGLETVPVKAMSFETCDDAKHWIINNQLGRRNISKYERCRLALLFKDSVATAAEQRMLAGKAVPAQISAEGTTGETRDILANLAGVSHDTLSRVETLEREADSDMRAKLRAGTLSINKAYNTLHPKASKSNTKKATSLDTSCVSADTDTSATDTLSSVDNDTTQPVSEVVTPEPQAPVLAQPSDAEISDNETSRVRVLEFINSDFGALPSDLRQFVSNNDFYCDEEVLEKDWSRSFTAFVPKEFSNAFWQKFQQAGEKHALTKVVVFVQMDNNTDIPCFNALTWVFSRYGTDIPFHVVAFDFTEESELTT